MIWLWLYTRSCGIFGFITLIHINYSQYALTLRFYLSTSTLICKNNFKCFWPITCTRQSILLHHRLYFFFSRIISFQVLNLSWIAPFLTSNINCSNIESIPEFFYRIAQIQVAYHFHFHQRKHLKFHKWILFNLNGLVLYG
jgi:hypothetical protein